MFGKFEEAYLKVIKECDENISECDKTPIKECDKSPIKECGDDIATEGEENGDVATKATKKSKRKVVKFFTEDPALIDALQSGFDSGVIAVKGEDDEEGDDVTFGPEVFEEVSVEDEPAEEDEAEDGDEEFNESITGAAGGAIAGGMLGGPVGAVAGGLLGSNL